MGDLEMRVVALERANRWYRLALGVVLLGAAGIALTGAGSQVPDQVQAKAFELVDASGKVLASISNYQGSGAVTTFNADGKYLTDIVPTKSGAGGLVTYDGAGHQNLKITDVAGGGGSLVINNPAGQGVLDLGHNNVGAGSLTIRNKDGKQIILLTSDTEHAGALLTYDPAGKQTGRLPAGG